MISRDHLDLSLRTSVVLAFQMIHHMDRVSLNTVYFMASEDSMPQPSGVDSELEQGPRTM